MIQVSIMLRESFLLTVICLVIAFYSAKHLHAFVLSLIDKLVALRGSTKAKCKSEINEKLEKGCEQSETNRTDDWETDKIYESNDKLEGGCGLSEIN